MTEVEVEITERPYKSLQGECIRPGTPLTKEDAKPLPI
jgi:hypothetical protein